MSWSVNVVGCLFGDSEDLWLPLRGWVQGGVQGYDRVVSLIAKQLFSH